MMMASEHIPIPTLRHGIGKRNAISAIDSEDYVGSLPHSLLKTSVIAFRSSDDNELPRVDNATRKRSLTWHGEGLQEAIFKRDLAKGPENDIVTEKRLSEQKLRSIMEDVLTERLQGIQYNHRETKKRCVEITREIHDRIKLNDNSLVFKYVVSSFIGEIRDAGIEAASQCVWDPEHDSMVTGYFKNETIFAIASIFSVYIGEKDEV